MKSKSLIFFLLALAAHSFAQTYAPPPLPVPGTRMSEAYVQQVGRSAYFWAWPMVNLHNRRLLLSKIPEPGLMGSIVPVAPLNSLCMLRDYIQPQERLVACPNQDVAYGFGILSMEQEPVVVQVPDFGDRFWVYQMCDQRTDGFGALGKMYNTRPGFYLLTGPNWKGRAPMGIANVFRSPTDLGVVIPRVFVTDDPADKAAIQPLLNGIVMYPLSQFDGKMKTKDWSKVPMFPNTSANQGDQETQWVVPDRFFDELATVMMEVPPLPGEQAMYANIASVLAAAANDEKLRAALKRAALEADTQLVAPLFKFQNAGVPLPYNWSTINNGAAFGVDYLSRTAAAKANIFVNRTNETKYYYQDLDEKGRTLNGRGKYTVTFSKGKLPPVKGFWSLTLYNQHHFFAPNEIGRFSLGTKNNNLKFNGDGSLTLLVQADAPADQTNWLPAPKDADFVLYMRAYWPEEDINRGKWTPPPVVTQQAAGQ